jgi:uncharacterized protein YgbK (DUF1537 family)
MITCLILADDLSGAADSAVSALHAGLDAEVFLRAEGVLTSRTAIVAIDLDTREIEAERARAITQKCLKEIHPPADLFLYRKVDSTLRGNVAVELAATIAAAGKRFILFASAFPANGRVTIGGKVYVDGEPLERFWSGKIGQPTSDFQTQMAHTGWKLEYLSLETVRRGKQEIYSTVSDLVAEGCTAFLCDAERDEDLFEIAQAGFQFGPQCLFAGSGGLAKQLFQLFPAGDLTIPIPGKLSQPILIAVGSFAKNSRMQFAELSDLSGLAQFYVGPHEFHSQPLIQAGFRQRLDAGEDLAVGIDANATFSDAREPAEYLADLLAPVLDRVGALVATGGQTCRLLLERIGAQRLQLLKELEPGVALASVVSPKPLLVVVKAGGFGGSSTLRNAYNYLKKSRSMS